MVVFEPVLFEEIVIASLKSILSAATLASAGLYLGRAGVMNKAGAKLISTISMRVTIPCLLFSKVLPSVDVELMLRVWPMLLLPLIFTTIGTVVGYVAVLICRPPPEFQRGMIAAIAFGNSTGMPLVLLTVIHAQLGYLFDPDQIAVTKDDPIVYLSVYLLTYPIMQWTFGRWLLTPEEPEEEEDTESAAATPVRSTPDAGAIKSASASNLKGMLDGEVASLSLLSYANGVNRNNAFGAMLTTPLIERRWKKEQKKTALGSPRYMKILAFIKDKVLVPPVVGVLCGLTCSVFRPAFWLLCGELAPGERCPNNNALFSWFTKAVFTIGGAAVPLNLILLGNSLSKGPDWQSLNVRSAIGIIVAKMVLMPAIALLLMMCLDQIVGHKGIWKTLESPWDKTFYLAAVAVTATPTANNVMVMTELSGQNGKAMSTAIFVQYMVAPVVLTGTLTMVLCVLTAW